MSIETVRADALAEFSTKLYDGEPIPEGSCEGIIADFIAARMCENECTREAMGCTPADATGDRLLAWGEAFCAGGKIPATTASGTITAYGTPGAIVPVGEEFSRCEGVTFKATEAVAIGADGTASVPVIACEVGSDSNTPAGYEFTWSGGTGISGTLSGGACEESEAAYQRRVKATMLERTCRLGEDTYTGWALQYPGVTRVWTVPNANGPGTIKVYVAMDDTYPNGIPTAADLQAIQDLIFGNPQGNGLQGVGPIGQVCAPSLCPIDIVFAGASTLAERAEIIAMLNDWFLTYGEPGREICRPELEAAISGLTGNCVRIVTPEVTQCGPGEIPVLGAVTW